MALYFADGDVERTVDAIYMATEDIDIPPGADAYERRFSMDVPADIELIDISPHMHYLGRSAEVTATLPDGERVASRTGTSDGKTSTSTASPSVCRQEAESTRSTISTTRRTIRPTPPSRPPACDGVSSQRTK